jgi:hypothetical protein
MHDTFIIHSEDVGALRKMKVRQQPAGSVEMSVLQTSVLIHVSLWLLPAPGQHGLANSTFSSPSDILLPATR